MKHPLLEPLLKEKLVVILRGLPPALAAMTGDALAASGVKFMEIPLNTPDAPEGIRILANHFSGTDIHIGAGTVLWEDDVDAVRDAGGEYIISPNTNASVIRRTRELGMLSMPGFQTPTEAFSAIEAGAHILKVFPCGTPRETARRKAPRGSCQQGRG